MDYPRIPRPHADRLLGALGLTRGDLPDWYLRRWHFHPDGYFSTAGVRWHALVIRPLYNWPAESGVLRYVSTFLREQECRAILDAGCGSGHVASAISRELPDLRVTAVDLSPWMVEAASRRLESAPGATAFRADLLEADPNEIPGAPFDCVLLIHVLGHVPGDVATGIVERSSGLVRPGGWLIVVDHAWHRPSTGFSAVRRRASRRFRGRMLRATVYQRTTTR